MFEQQQAIISNREQEQAIIQAATDEAIRQAPQRAVACSIWVYRGLLVRFSLSNSRCHGSLCNTVLVFVWLTILAGSLAAMARCSIVVLPVALDLLYVWLSGHNVFFARIFGSPYH